MKAQDALQYVANTNGGASVRNFIDDFEPIGKLMWGTMAAANYVWVDDVGKIWLTDTGKAKLDELKAG